VVEGLPPRWRRYPQRTFVVLEPGPRSLFFENFAVFPDRLRREMLPHDDGAASDPYSVGLRCYAGARGSPLERMGQTDLETYLRELLMKQDQMSMAASIESRVPFLDDVLIEQVAAIPARFKLRGWRTKAILRAAVQDLVPPEILTRKKMGFPVPLGRWLRTSFQPVMDEFVLGARARERGFFDAAAVRQLAGEHCDGAVEHGDRLWLLINLEIWLRIYLDGEDPAEVMRPIWKRRIGGPHASALAENGRSLA